jgi:hypothetical protein
MRDRFANLTVFADGLKGGVATRARRVILSPMSPTALSIRALNSSVGMLEIMCGDLSPAEYLHRPVPKANCAAWIVGHLVISTRWVAAKLGGGALPPLPDGFEKRFSQKDGAPEAAEFGDVSILIPELKAATAALAKVIEALPEDKLSEPLEGKHPMFQILGDFVAFAPLHNVSHAGQVSTIRRSLGRPPVI